MTSPGCFVGNVKAKHIGLYKLDELFMQNPKRGTKEVGTKHEIRSKPANRKRTTTVKTKSKPKL